MSAKRSFIKKSFLTARGFSISSPFQKSTTADVSVALPSIQQLSCNDVAHNVIFRDYKVHKSATKWEKVNGLGITPHVYTKKYDLDQLVEAIFVASKT